MREHANSKFPDFRLRNPVRCELDTNAYSKGIKVSDAEMADLNIKGDAFHPEWNYTISPRSPKTST